MIYFLIYLFFEVLFSVEIASQIGGLNTFIEIVLSVVIGISIISNLKYNLISTFQEFATGEINIQQLKSRNIFPLVGAVLLIIPGFLTDFFGILMQFSFITDFLSKSQNPYKTDKIFEAKSGFQNQDYKPDFKYDDDIIEVKLDKDNK